jgi:hypothetical protein
MQAMNPAIAQAHNVPELPPREVLEAHARQEVEMVKSMEKSSNTILGVGIGLVSGLLGGGGVHLFQKWKTPTDPNLFQRRPILLLGLAGPVIGGIIGRIIGGSKATAVEREANVVIKQQLDDMEQKRAVLEESMKQQEETLQRQAQKLTDQAQGATEQVENAVASVLNKDEHHNASSTISTDGAETEVVEQREQEVGATA